MTASAAEEWREIERYNKDWLTTARDQTVLQRPSPWHAVDNTPIKGDSHTPTHFRREPEALFSGVSKTKVFDAQGHQKSNERNGQDETRD